MYVGYINIFDLGKLSKSLKNKNLDQPLALKECGLTTLETQRLRGDQIEMFKILNGYKNSDL